jgi:hypothetical protein
MITKWTKHIIHFFIWTPYQWNTYSKIDVKELINFLKNNLGDEVSELGLINELQSNTADLSDDKPKSYQQKQMKLILALIIITNKLMNGFQKNQNHLEMKLKN